MLQSNWGIGSSNLQDDPLNQVWFEFEWNSSLIMILARFAFVTPFNSL